jgi:hypothetical protein
VKKPMNLRPAARTALVVAALAAIAGAGAGISTQAASVRPPVKRIGIIKAAAAVKPRPRPIWTLQP